MPEVILPPALVMLAGAFIAALGGRRLRPLIALVAPLLTLYVVWQIPDGSHYTAHFLGYDLELLEGSRVRRLFATAFTITAFAAALFGLGQAKWWELAAALGYAAGAIGVSFAGDLITMYIYWEVMALFSTVVVWSGGTEASRRAGIRYVILHLVSGILLKVGIEGVTVDTGSMVLRPLALDSVGAWIVLGAVLVKAAAAPVSHWLADAYPESSATGGVWLSAFTTKTAVLALFLLFPGAPILIAVGLWMAFYGIIYALLENDSRRLLSYALVSQVGLMVCGVGIGTPLALNGVAAYAFVQVIFMALLFMCAGSVLHMTGKRRLTELGGLVRSMPITTICAVVGALSMVALPLTSGFVAGPIIAAAAGEERLTAVWFLLIAASAGAFLYAARFSWFVFFQQESDVQATDPPWNMRAAMILVAGISLGLGMVPGVLYASLPYPLEYMPYAGSAIVMQLQLLLFAGLAFYALRTLLRPANVIILDWDWIYRRLGSHLATETYDRALAGWRGMIGEPRQRWDRLMSGLFRTYGPHGPLARSWPTGSMVLWVGILLSAYLVLALI